MKIGIFIKSFLITTFLSSLTLLAFAQGISDVFDAGEAFESLKQNNAIIGLLYGLVGVEAIIIVILWKKIDKINEKLIQNYEERIAREENLHTQITRLTTEIELIKDSNRRKRN